MPALGSSIDAPHWDGGVRWLDIGGTWRRGNNNNDSCLCFYLSGRKPAASRLGSFLLGEAVGRYQRGPAAASVVTFGLIFAHKACRCRRRGKTQIKGAGSVSPLRTPKPEAENGFHSELENPSFNSP